MVESFALIGVALIIDGPAKSICILYICINYNQCFLHNSMDMGSCLGAVQEGPACPLS